MRTNAVAVTHAKTTDLYEQDESAWLEKTIRILRLGRLSELDSVELVDYLTAMAKSEQHEVLSRLEKLMAHLLKWEFQPDKRTTSWRLTIREQCFRLQDKLQSKTLRRFANKVLKKAYERAVTLAADETELPRERFPADCPYTVAELLSIELKD